MALFQHSLFHNTASSVSIRCLERQNEQCTNVMKKPVPKTRRRARARRRARPAMVTSHCRALYFTTLQHNGPKAESTRLGGGGRGDKSDTSLRPTGVKPPKCAYYSWFGPQICISLSAVRFQRSPGKGKKWTATEQMTPDSGTIWK